MNPKISIVLPIHEEMKGGPDFLWKNIDMITKQSFQDFEIIISKTGLGMARNTNAGIKRAKGEIIKILFLDDILAHENALEDIVDAFDNSNQSWLITAVNNNLHPYWTSNITTGNNKLGSPSALAFRNECKIYFDENMQWLLDCDLYQRMYDTFGLPIILDNMPHVNIGIHDGQMTNILTEKEKKDEEEYLNKKYHV